MRSEALTIICLTLLAGAAHGDSRGTTPEPPASPAASAPALQAPAPARDAGEAEALLALQEEGRKAVEQLAARLASLPPGPERDRVQGDIVVAKLETRERMLRALASFALARGDVQEAEEARIALEALRAPVPRAVALSPATKEGGAE